jgi:hypothetical protein
LLLKVVFGFVELPWSKRCKEFENQTLLTGKIALVIDDIAQKCHQADAERGRDWGPTSNSYKSSCSESFFPFLALIGSPENFHASLFLLQQQLSPFFV